MNEKLIEKVKATLEVWQDTGTDYVVSHSFDGVAREIIPIIAEEIVAKLEGDCPHRIMADPESEPDISLRKKRECWECIDTLKQGRIL